MVEFGILWFTKVNYEGERANVSHDKSILKNKQIKCTNERKIKEKKSTNESYGIHKGLILLSERLAIDATMLI